MRCISSQLAHPGLQRRLGVRANRLFEAFEKLVGESNSLVGKVETNAGPPALPLQLTKRVVRPFASTSRSKSMLSMLAACRLDDSAARGITRR
jgi:hypothetical protein